MKTYNCIIIFYCLLNQITSFAQKKTMEDDNIDKWKRAVIHLECATNSISHEDSHKEFMEAVQLRKDQKITEEEYVNLIKKSSVSRDIRYNGTGVFVKVKGKRYIVTARHVLWDELEARRDYDREVKWAESWPIDQRQELLDRAKERGSKKIFSIVYRVPSLDKLIKSSAETRNISMHREYMMNLGAGSYDLGVYTFSSPELDLAVISLDNPNDPEKEFADALEEDGYRPISIDDIAHESLIEGTDVMAVGYPSATAVLGQVNISEAQRSWASGQFSLPVFSFGKVSMENSNLYFFWTDISIYPGNSGGAVVSKNKLVGIVSAQALIPVEGGKDMFTRIPFGKIIKAKYLFELIDQQDKKDQKISDLRKGIHPK